MPKTIKEFQLNQNTGEVSVEYSDDSTSKFNAADMVTAQTDPVTGGIDFSAPIGPRGKNTIVILGSSNGAGQGASTYVSDPSAANGYASPSTSWAGLLKAALGANWNVVNRSISGTGVVQSAARFWTDVAPHNPSHVIICNHPRNDGYDPNAILKATMQIIAYCDQIGAVPILRGAYLDNAMTANQYQAMLGLNNALDALGRHRIDHMSQFDNGSGGWIGGTTWTADGLHPNDAGYAHQFASIDTTLFSNLAPSRRSQIIQAGVWDSPAPGTGSQGPGISIAGVPWGVKSFTMRARFYTKSVSATNAVAFMAAERSGSTNGNQALRVRNPHGLYEVTQGSSTIGLSSVATNVVGWHDVAVRYNAATDNVDLIIDGVMTNQGTNPDTNKAGIWNNWFFGARGDVSANGISGYGMTGLALWSVPLSDDQLRKLYAGQVPPASLLFYSDFTGDPPAAGSGAVIANCVPNGIRGIVGGTQFSRLYGQG